MTKQERETLAQKSNALDIIQNLLQKGLYPGVAASDVVRSQQFVLKEWELAQLQLTEEAKRIEALANGEAKAEAANDQQSAA